MSYGNDNTCVCDICKNYRGDCDLYYGLNKPRQAYLDHLELKGKIKPNLRNPLVYTSTIDYFNNWTWLDCYIDERDKLKLTEILKNINEIHSLNLNLYSHLSHLGRLLENFSRNLRLLRIHEPQMTNDKKLRRACKYGIMFARAIHFVLDEFDPARILKPREQVALFPQENPINFNISFTTSEIRFIFRHWSILRGRILFYYEGKRLSRPPWEFNESFKNYFSHYASKREERRTFGMDVVRTFEQLKSIWIPLLCQEMESLEI